MQFHEKSQGSKIALVRSNLRVPQSAGQVKILIFLLKIKKIPINANNFCDAGKVPIFSYFEACSGQQDTPRSAQQFVKTFHFEELDV